MKQQYFQKIAFADAIERKRGGDTFRQVAERIGTVSASTLCRLVKQKPADMATILDVCQWLQQPISDFITTTAIELPAELAKFVYQKRIESAAMQSKIDELGAQQRLLNSRIDRVYRQFESGTTPEIIMRYFDERDGK